MKYDSMTTDNFWADRAEISLFKKNPFSFWFASSCCTLSQILRPISPGMWCNAKWWRNQKKFVPTCLYWSTRILGGGRKLKKIGKFGFRWRRKRSRTWLIKFGGCRDRRQLSVTTWVENLFNIIPTDRPRSRHQTSGLGGDGTWIKEEWRNK